MSLQDWEVARMAGERVPVAVGVLAVVAVCVLILRTLKKR